MLGRWVGSAGSALLALACAGAPPPANGASAPAPTVAPAAPEPPAEPSPAPAATSSVAPPTPADAGPAGDAEAPPAAMTIPALRAARPVAGHYLVEGDVALVYFCLPCPKHAHCQPCDTRHIMLTTGSDTIRVETELGHVPIASRPLRVGAHVELEIAAGPRGFVLVRVVRAP